MSNKQHSAPVEEMTAYVYDDITYVPKYGEPLVYVGPGYPRRSAKTYTEYELIEAGAVATKLMLWPREEEPVTVRVGA
jgi:hypothetical protein